MRRLMLAGLLAVSVVGCASKKDLEKAQTEATALAAEKDSLLSEVLATTKLVSDINGELAKAKGLGVSPTTPSERASTSAAEDRQILLGKIREAVARLNESEAQLERAKTRLGSLEKKDARLVAQVNQFQSQIAELRTNIETQQKLIEEQGATIAQQKVQIDSLGAEVTTTKSTNVALTDSVTKSEAKRAEAFVAIGKKDSLKAAGVIVEEGSKFLVFGSKKTLPARKLSQDAFRKIDIRTDRTIDLPAGKKYKLLSRQDPSFLQPGPDGKGKLVGPQTITDPEAFWTASKYLVLVED
jgi:predicted  nucleic acid-binding Zn-ribbon protein